MAASQFKQFWRSFRPLAVPFVLCIVLVFTLREPVLWWLQGQHRYDEESLKEWVEEARIVQTLPELVATYLDLDDAYQQLLPKGESDAKRDTERRLSNKRAEIAAHLKALSDPLTRMYPRQLPLFPLIYRIEVRFDPARKLLPIEWDSELPRASSQYRKLGQVRLDDRGSSVAIEYQLHAYTQRQYKERQDAARGFWLSGLAVLLTTIVLAWAYIAQRRERERERQRLRTEQQVHDAERLRLHEELRRQDAERKQQDAERQTLELKSQLFANIGIMAGSYAHNIKNLLVRPNDLLRRCLGRDGVPAEQTHMLDEIRQTLGTVTQRLQQILQTVRRDPTKSERVRIDLNRLITELQRTWAELAREKWKLDLRVDLSPGPLWIEGDPSHLQQALENLLFNARDATFEMRNALRDQARHSGTDQTEGESDGTNDRRRALIAAAGWKGEVVLRTRQGGEHAVLEVHDNGIGMTAEVRRRCTETHFSTKRDNALFAGLSAGMGLGLSFVVVILDHHGATLDIESEPLRGATFRVSLPLATNICDPAKAGQQA
jgi:signal transduction histidine kinase